MCLKSRILIFGCSHHICSFIIISLLLSTCTLDENWSSRIRHLLLHKKKQPQISSKKLSNYINLKKCIIQCSNLWNQLRNWVYYKPTWSTTVKKIPLTKTKKLASLVTMLMKLLEQVLYHIFFFQHKKCDKYNNNNYNESYTTQNNPFKSGYLFHDNHRLTFSQVFLLRCTSPQCIASLVWKGLWQKLEVLHRVPTHHEGICKNSF